MTSAHAPHRSPATTFALAAVSATVLGACVSAGPVVEERPATAEVGPIEQPVMRVGDSIAQVVLVDEYTGLSGAHGYTVDAVDDDGTLSATSANDCSWRQGADLFSPSLAWNDCGKGEWASGTRTISATGGEMWPLVPGNEASWRWSNRSSEGSTGNGTRECEVQEPVAISVAVGEVDALKVVCVDRTADGTGTRTWYFTEEHGEVKYIERGGDGKARFDVERAPAGSV